MLPFMAADDNVKAIDRIQKVGPVPRYIISEAAYKKRMLGFGCFNNRDGAGYKVIA
jgi:hypothetical protein